MRWKTPLTPCTLIRRYQRFLADVTLADGRELTVHCANSGAMTGCFAAGWRGLLSTSANPRRKYADTLELVHNGVCWIAVNTQRANQVAAEALSGGLVAGLPPNGELRREVKPEVRSRSRLDFCWQAPRGRCWIEAKSVTLVDAQGRAAFPDAVTTRGRRHLEELEKLIRAGDQAMMLFVLLRSDGEGFAPAADVDPNYSRALFEAASVGVRLEVLSTTVTEAGIHPMSSEPAMIGSV